MPRRGCGDRADGGLYVEVEMSEDGMPVDWFIVDPALPFDGKLPRSPLIIPDSNNVNHLLLGIGKSFYPFVSDFVEEVRWMGVSKRIPADFDLSILTPNRSALVLAHPRAIPLFDYDLRREWCPRKVSGKPDLGSHQCVGDNWDLSSVRDVKWDKEMRHEVHVDENSEWVQVVTPSCRYEVMKAYELSGDRMTVIRKYQGGIVLKFPRFRFSYVDRPDGPVDPIKKKKQIQKVEKVLTGLGYSFKVVDE